MATTFNTRIQLKYDTYTNWNTNNPTLLKGELAIVEVPVETGVSQIEPTYLLKVGDGVSDFKTLKWISGTAADVYAWAKAATKPEYNANEIIGLEAFIGEKVKDTDTQYQIIANGNMGFKLQSQPKEGGGWTDVSEITLTPPTYNLITGDTNGTVKFGIRGSETEVAVAGLKSAAFVDTTAFDAAGSAETVQDNLDEYETSNDAVIAGIKNGTTINSFGQVETALTQNLQSAKDYTDEQITGLNISQYATTTSVTEAITASENKLIGTSGDLSSANTINAAKKYADEKIAAQISSVYKPAGSVAFESLPTPAASLVGNVYNVTNAFAADDEFVSGEVGNKYPAGTNVVVIEESDSVYKFDALTGVTDLSAYSTTEQMNQAISTSAASTLQSAKEYTDGKITDLNISQYAKTTEVTSAINQAKTDLIGTSTTSATATTIKGAVDEAKTYADGINATLSGQISTLSGRVDTAEGDITALEGLVGNTAVATQITNAINALDVADTAVAGQFVTQVVETDGKIAVTRGTVDIAQLTQGGGETIIFNCGNSTL